MDFRECESIYKCGKGTEESCRRALCPFYKPCKAKGKEAVKESKVKMHIKEGRWILDDFSGLWRYIEE